MELLITYKPCTVLLLGFLFDLLVGDPPWLYHPVRLIGWAIAQGEKRLRPLFPATPSGERAAGALLSLLIVGLSGFLSWGLLCLAGWIHPLFELLLSGWLCGRLLAATSLRRESRKVFTALQSGSLPAARAAVSMIVGRDTAGLSREGVTRAAVETVAENTSDGVIAPMLFIALGGIPLGFVYKAINTLDSMVGYKNERYRYFGWFAARLDDAANFFPARLSALFMIAAAFLCRQDGKEGWRIFKRDRFCHASPNSAQTESVCAGALHLRLAGEAFYFGKLVKKPTIGDDLRPIEPQDILRAGRMMMVSSLLCLLCCLAVQAGMIFFLERLG